MTRSQRPDRPTDPDDERDPTDVRAEVEAARTVAVEMAALVGRISARGRVPDALVDDLTAEAGDGALAILLDVADGSLSPDLVQRLAGRLLPQAGRMHRSRSVVPLTETLRHHPDLAAALLARDDVLDSLLGGPPRPRLDRALVRVLEAVAPRRSPQALAAVVRRCADPAVRLDRLARGVTTLLVESFDEVAGLAGGVPGWTPLDRHDLEVLLTRLRAHPSELARLGDRCAAHGRLGMAVAGAWGADALADALQRAVDVFALLAVAAGDEREQRAAYLGVTATLMRVTALQLLLDGPPATVPDDVAAAWPTDGAGARLAVGALGRRQVEALVDVLDRHHLLALRPDGFGDGVPTPYRSSP